jgi:AhpD family alkylhydroperoxidase
MDTSSNLAHPPMARAAYWTLAPEGTKALTALYGYLPNCGLEASLLHLVFLRVSQINGCAYCVDRHGSDALAAGETIRRVNSVITWRESPFFTPRERAAFNWAETLTTVAATHAPDADYLAAREEFSEKELVDLSLAICLMNALNRMAIGFRRRPAEQRP